MEKFKKRPVTAIKNIGMIFTGDVDEPLIEGPATILMEDGQITAIQKGNIPFNGPTIDAKGMTVCPGFIDSHSHPVFGDFTPRQSQIGFVENGLHGGVTSMISAGEVHLPGRSEDPSGAKALAILAHKSFERFRPSGVKVYGGALILEKGLCEEDFREVSEQGVWLVAEIGLGSVSDIMETKQMVQWARKCGMKVLMHVGGTSALGSLRFTTDDVLAINPDVACHLNSAPTSFPPDEGKRIIEKTDSAIEIVYCGNFLTAFEIAKFMRNSLLLHRLIIGSDAPSGVGVIPLAIWRMVTYMSAMCGIPAEIAICCATGNTQRVFGLRHGKVKEGMPADIQIIDLPSGSHGIDAKSAIESGNIPGIAMVIIDGEIKVSKSRNTPPALRSIE